MINSDSFQHTFSYVCIFNRHLDFTKWIKNINSKQFPLEEWMNAVKNNKINWIKSHFFLLSQKKLVLMNCFCKFTHPNSFTNMKEFVHVCVCAKRTHHIL